MSANHDTAMRAIIDAARACEGVREVIYNPRKPWPEIIVTVSARGLGDARRTIAPLAPQGVALMFGTEDVPAGVLSTGAKREPITRAPRLLRAERDRCHASRGDGECNWQHCPQEANNRANYQPHCPLDVRNEDDE